MTGTAGDPGTPEAEAPRVGGRRLGAGRLGAGRFGAGRLGRVLGDRMLSNMASLAVLQVGNYVLPLVTLPYLVRTLGLAGYGELNFGLAFVQYFLVLTGYGFALSATQAVARCAGDRRELSEIFWAVLACKVLLALAGLAVLAVLTASVPILRESWPVLLAGYTVVLADVLLPTWLWQGVERMGTVTVCTISAKAVSVPATFLLVQGPGDSWVAALIQGMTGVLAAVLSLVAVRRRGLVGWARPTGTVLRRQMAAGWHIFLSNVAISLYTSTTSVLLGFLAGTVAVGEFAAADKVRQAVQYVVSPISTAAYPRICVLIQQDREKGFRFIRLLLLGQGGITLVLSAATLVLAEPIIHLVYGARYGQAIECLRWLSLLPFVIGLSNVLGVQTMLPLGMKKAFSNVLVASGLVNILLLLLLVPSGGTVGAAVALLVTETVITLAMAVLLARRHVPLLGPLSGPPRLGVT